MFSIYACYYKLNICLYYAKIRVHKDNDISRILYIFLFLLVGRGGKEGHTENKNTVE